MRTAIGTLLLSLLCGCSTPLAPDAIIQVTPSEQAEIVPIIRRETKDKILSISRKSEDTVLVVTGWRGRPGYLEGAGQKFVLQRTKTGWTIRQKLHWVS
jgi:hypothetical protein